MSAECQTSFGLLQTDSLLKSDQMSNFSVSVKTDQSSPPYSQACTEQQFSTPERFHDQRTETPTSDQLNIDFSTNNGYSPDVTTSSDRDPSPDTVSTSSGCVADVQSEPSDAAEIKPVDDVDIKQQLLRMGFPESLHDPKTNPLNLLASFNSSLLSDKLSASVLAEKLSQKPLQMPVIPNIPTPTSTATSTPEVAPTTKRKRQRRNPVWPYFDVVDGTAKCKQCLYSTKSVFSTNLKVHLRSHHRADYEKVIQAEDALNLNALLLSGNSGKLFSTDVTRKRMPPMTSSILMTLNKLTSQQGEDNPLNSVLRQTLAAGSLSQHLQQMQSQLASVQAAQQQQQQKPVTQQFPLNAANLAALNNLARMAPNNNNQPSVPMTAEQFINQFNFPTKPPVVKSEIPSSPAPHGTDPNGMPQPKRRRLRRHPVWMFFKDLEDRMVGCINCTFSTGSAFSTNLKMHLKAHHKEDYERVLKLEDDMRIEEGIFGPTNKIKSELIDFIRGGGNASTPTAGPANASAPKASPLVQQIISQTMARRSPQPQARVQTPMKKEVMEEDFNSMSMSDKLAALVGLTPSAGSVEGEVVEEKSAPPAIAPATLEDIRRAAENIFAANMGLQPPPQEQTIVALNGSVVQSSDNKSTSSASTDISDDKNKDRDRALARFWVDQGSSDDLLNNEFFKALAVMAENAEMAEAIAEEALHENLCELDDQQPGPSSAFEVSNESANPGEDEEGIVELAGRQLRTVFDISALNYEAIFDALSNFERALGLTEAIACRVLMELLKSSAKTPSEVTIVEAVASSLDKIADLVNEPDKNERLRKLVSEKMKLKRLFETPAQRAQRLERMRQRYRQTKAERTETSSEPAARKRALQNAERTAEAAKEERLRRLREYQRRRLERELPEQRERRLAKMRLNQKLRRERMNAQKNNAGTRNEDLIRALAPDYELPDAAHLAALVEDEAASALP